MRFGIGAQQPQTWQEVVEELEEKFESIIEHVWVKEVSLEELFSQLHEVLQNAQDSGLFSCPRDAIEMAAPSYKWCDWARLSQNFGIACPWTHKSAYKREVAGAAWGPQGEHENLDRRPGPVLWQFNPTLPDNRAIIQLTTARGMTAEQCRTIGQREADKINWTEIAVSLNRPLDGGYLKMICKRTSWRRALGRTVRQVPHFTASDHRGHAIGRLGTDLALATVNLIAIGKEDSVKML